MQQPKLEYLGTFIKTSGAARTMRFVTSPYKLRAGGLITVFDVERRACASLTSPRSSDG